MDVGDDVFFCAFPLGGLNSAGPVFMSDVLSDLHGLASSPCEWVFRDPNSSINMSNALYGRSITLWSNSADWNVFSAACWHWIQTKKSRPNAGPLTPPQSITFRYRFRRGSPDGTRLMAGWCDHSLDASWLERQKRGEVSDAYPGFFLMHQRSPGYPNYPPIGVTPNNTQAWVGNDALFGDWGQYGVFTLTFDCERRYIAVEFMRESDGLTKSFVLFENIDTTCQQPMKYVPCAITHQPTTVVELL